MPIAITIDNWASVLRSGRHKEVLNIWMRKEVPSITVQPTVNHHSGGELNTGQPGGERVRVPLLIKPFLTWPIVDEFGKLDDLPLEDRYERFLRAFVLDLPVPVTMSRQERARRPKQASVQRVAAKASISIPGKTRDGVRNEIEVDGDNTLANEIRDKFSRLLDFFLPNDFASDPILLYWGAVSIITVRILLRL